MKYLILILILVSEFSFGQENYDEGCFEITQITLEISTSFKGSVYYLYRPKVDGGECLIKISESENGSESYKVKRYSLSEESNIPKAFSDALNVNLRDGIKLHDGTTWIIRSHLYQEFEISISTPEYMTKERGYVNLLKFREFLDKELEGENNS
ncbi:hypothetical protein HBA55_36915 [Pseudomaricurvus alkylphenolicus]|uniref:hypothetical protein n=1 Tax=Pseudomaricurvus alkylphenolicus TaxID=1306991 RepID=UPI001422A4B7|nr:hypothetical protein [Pseudomaricurvus alkylphenolicus]NIB45214.1 hypothetical protein [Pseudomaricurvus alkylphenolicus]